MTATRPELALERILHAIEADLIDVSQDEIAASLKELGLSLGMKGSAALLDVRYPLLRERIAERRRHRGVEMERGDDGADQPSELRQTDRQGLRDD